MRWNQKLNQWFSVNAGTILLSTAVVCWVLLPTVTIYALSFALLR